MLVERALLFCRHRLCSIGGVLFLRSRASNLSLWTLIVAIHVVQSIRLS
jgi:hypothetical protein